MDATDIQSNGAGGSCSGLKRKREEIINGDEPLNKISNKEPRQTIQSEYNKFNFLHFSDEILLEILLHCDGPTLRNLSRFVYLNIKYNAYRQYKNEFYFQHFLSVHAPIWKI